MRRAFRRLDENIPGAGDLENWNSHLGRQLKKQYMLISVATPK